jgi:hypothetical protein
MEWWQVVGAAAGAAGVAIAAFKLGMDWGNRGRVIITAHADSPSLDGVWTVVRIENRTRFAVEVIEVEITRPKGAALKEVWTGEPLGEWERVQRPTARVVEPDKIEELFYFAGPTPELHGRPRLRLEVRHRHAGKLRTARTAATIKPLNGAEMDGLSLDGCV